jgi:16S rRNA (cytidine1402-2'-O)-methyltransferase
LTAKTYAIGAQTIEPVRPASGLYIVATPIGNLRDITLRALDILASADVVLCEDTRHSARLFEAYAIKSPRTPLHDHNERARISEIVSRLEKGEVIALISDAGTPLLSDPGFPLVRAVREAGLPVFPVPGPSALLAALTGAGLPTDAFSFLGFLPPKTGQRVNALTPFAQRPETLVFYESPRRLGAALADMATVFGAERQAVVALELTKKFERFIAGPLADLAEDFAEDTKGEAVIIVAGATKGEAANSADWHRELELALKDSPLRAVVDEITARHALKRKEVYDAALALKNRG